MNRRRALWIAIPALLVYVLALQGFRNLWEPDEGRYTDVALEMIRLSNWLVPHLHHEQEHWTKPPLTYWSLATSLLVFGRNLFAVRLPGALAYLLSIAAVGWAGRVLVPRRPWLAALVYATLLAPSVASNFITTDGLLTLWETVAVACFVQSTWGASGRRRGAWILLMACAFGLVFLTKGPPGMLPLLAIGAFLLLTARSDAGLGRWWAVGLVLWAAIVLAWFGQVIAAHPELLDRFVRVETVDRVSQGHQNPRWYGPFTIYLPTLLLGSLPWTASLWRSLRRRIPAALRSLRPPRASPAAQDLFLLLWVGLPLTVFCLVPSRLPLYVLPLFAPLALLAARELEAATGLFRPRRVAWLAAWALLLVSLRAAAALLPQDAALPDLARAISAAAGDQPFIEVVTVTRDPLLGLSFYLDREVEHIAVSEVPEEIPEHEGRMWVVTPRKVPGFLGEVPPTVQMEERARIGDRYVIYREHSVRDAPGAPDQ